VTGRIVEIGMADRFEVDVVGEFLLGARSVRAFLSAVASGSLAGGSLGVNPFTVR
jgi:hypothetical protein